MTREEQLLLFANSYSNKLAAITKHPPVTKRYSKASRDRIVQAMRYYYKQVSTTLSSDEGKAE